MTGGGAVFHRPESFMQVRPSGTTGRGVFARSLLEEGTHIGYFEGRAGARSRTTLQLGPDLHIEAPLSGPLPWINHSCQPNLELREREVWVRRRVEPGGELTLDYTLYESELSHPFVCHCGEPGCLGEVRGFLHLDDAARAERWDRFPAWVRQCFGPGA